MLIRTTLVALALSAPLHAQTLLHQPTGSATPGSMPAEVLARIDDPFFNIVIEAAPQPTNLVALINTVLDGGRSDFQSFVVGEQIG